MLTEESFFSILDKLSFQIKFVKNQKSTEVFTIVNFLCYFLRIGIKFQCILHENSNYKFTLKIKINLSE